MDLILAFLPQPVQSFYYTYYTPYATYVHPVLKRTFFLAQATFYSTVYPILYPVYALLVSRLNYETNGPGKSHTSDNAPVLSLVVALVALYISLWVLNFVRRRLVALVSTLMYFAFYAVVLILGIYVYNRGIEGTVADVQLLLELLGSLEQQGQKRGQRVAGQKSREAQRKGSRASGQGRGSRQYRYG